MDTPDTASTLDTPDKLDTVDTLETPEKVDTADTLDTLTLARQDREGQGPWEVEYSYGEEADLYRHYDSCTKNPGHKNFIPVDTFSIKDLPEGYRDNAIVDYIKVLSDLTVRVTVSERRPETVGIKPYPGHPCRGQRRITVGTGWVHRVIIWNDEMGQMCECKDCRTSSTPQTKFAKISVRTAAYVCYDESGGDHITCHLFFNKGTPETCEGVVTLTGMRCWRINTDVDYCYMDHYTHDLGLAQILQSRYQEKENLRCNMRAKLLETTNIMCRQPTLDMRPLSVIVSHPHGCSKHVSISRCHSLHEQPNEHRHTYSTATCPGSSGAPVDLLNSEQLFIRYHSISRTHVLVFENQPSIRISST
ncbi:hypothetical protein BsWGS_01018 [Bradybaena similaris]